MVQLEDGEKEIFRLLDVDNRVIFPTGVHTRILVSSIDYWDEISVSIAIVHSRLVQ